MPLTEAQKKANIKYRKENVKRIPLDVQKEKYEEIATAAKQVGESVNGYIKNAIDERMERDGFLAAPQAEPQPCPVPAESKPIEQHLKSAVLSAKKYLQNS